MPDLDDLIYGLAYMGETVKDGVMYLYQRGSAVVADQVPPTLLELQRSLDDAMGVFRNWLRQR
jgi:hypothetical protein